MNYVMSNMDKLSLIALSQNQGTTTVFAVGACVATLHAIKIMAGLGRRSHYRKHLTDAVLNDLPEPDGIGQRIARVVGTRGGNMFDVIVAPPSSSSSSSYKELSNVEDGITVQRVGEEVIISKSTTDANGNGKQLTPQSSETKSNDQPPIHSIQRAPQLAFLPTKFRKLVWIKRNDFVIVRCGDEEDEVKSDQKESSSGGGGGFRYVVSHILYKDQVKHIKSKGLWPLDPFFADADLSSGNGAKGEGETKLDQQITGDNKAKEESYPDDNDEGGSESQHEGTYEDNGIVFDDPLGDEFMVNTNRLAKLTVEDSSSDEDSD